MRRTRAPTPDPAPGLKLSRVLPYRVDATEGQPGHPLFIPTPKGAGRADAPGTYSVLYAADEPAGAVAEAFAGVPVWTETMFEKPALGPVRRALASYELSLAAAVLDLDDADALKRLGLRPSDVVTRDRSVTQRWALAAYLEHRWVGVRWWSYHDPRWHSFALWDLRKLRVIGVDALSLQHPAVAEAAAVLGRPTA